MYRGKIQDIALSAQQCGQQFDVNDFFESDI